MIPIKQWPWKKISLLSGGFLIFVFILLFALKNVIFNYLVESKIKHFNETHKGKISVKMFKLSGINEIAFDSILITSPFDTLCTIDTMNIRINTWEAVFGNISINEIYWENTHINICKYDSTYNYTFLFNKINPDTLLNKKKEEPDYIQRTKMIMNMLFDALPEKGNISNITIAVKRKDDDDIQISIPFININNYRMNFPLLVSDKNEKQTFFIASIIFSDDKTIFSKIVSSYKTTDFLPGFRKMQLKAHIDTAVFSISQEFQHGNLVLHGDGELLHLLINQPSLSYSDIAFDHLQLNYQFIVSKNSFTLDSTSVLQFNKLTFNPYIRFQVYPTKQLEIHINKPSFPAQELFSSLPEGLFHDTYGIKAKGNLSYHLNFTADFSLIDSLKLESELKPEHFYITSYGNVNLAKLDSDFYHTVYEKEEPVEVIHVSYSNPDFIPISQIAPYLRNALLCTEDGAFYWHRGFIQEAFQQALIQDIKSKRFVRGGSTITMQLVKNLYLNRHKTISRKLEEMLLVWLIEDMRLCSKDRMFELYLNIIEFGPGIYGVSKGSHFYFNKKPSELSLPEAIFMASIVPKPKHFVSSFDSTGTLKPAVQDFIKFVANRMLSKNMITQPELDAFQPIIKLTGVAKNMLKSKKDTTKPELVLPLGLP
jgi:hypothetical protein